MWPGMRPGGRGGPSPGEGAGQREGRVLHGDDLAATGRENLQEVETSDLILKAAKLT